MKLRTTHNSIRIRVRKSELTLLQEKQNLEESILFPNGSQFKFALVLGTHDLPIEAKLEDQQMVLSISKAAAAQWILTNQVSIETQYDLANGEQLHLLIEKDFPCLDRPNEDKSDTFWELAPDQPDSC
jgi:hypothetical protein